MPRRTLLPICSALIALVLPASALVLQAPAFALPGLAVVEEDDPNWRLAEEIFAELIRYESIAARPEQIVMTVEAMRDRLLAGGFAPDDVQVVSPDETKASLVARYRGSGARAPLLLMAHIDVVPADGGGWSFPPFEFGKDERYYYGRGSTDNKAGAAILVASFLRLRADGFVPDRDLIMVLTGDEETDGAHIAWLVNERRDLVDAELALNTDAGGGRYDHNGEPQVFGVQTAEKVYQTFAMTTVNPGGHSSVPRADNAIYDLAVALSRVAEHQFPVRLNDTTAAVLENMAGLTPGEAGDDMRAATQGDMQAAERVAAGSPVLNSTLRTTCVATQLSGGHADNALPRSASAIVNCRVFPGVPIQEVQDALQQLVADTGARIEPTGEATPSPPSPVSEDVMAPLRELVQEFWPGTPVVPGMSTGATDGLFVRNGGIPVYGVSALFGAPDDIRAHGLDERVGIAEFHRAREFWHRMLRLFAS